MIGHSIGEYVAACLAKVFSLEDALALVATRGQLMQSLPAGAMLAVMLSERETRALLTERSRRWRQLTVAKNCVVSGTSEAIQELHDQLKQQDIHSQLLHTSHAFHSEMMEPILEPFTRTRQASKTKRTGDSFSLQRHWRVDNGATNNRCGILVTHLRQTVRFADGLA